MAKLRMEYLSVVILFCVVVVSLREGEGKEEGESVEIKNGSSIIQPRGEGKLKGEDDFAQISIWYIGQGAPDYLSVSGASLNYGKWVPGWGDYSTEIGSPNGKRAYYQTEIRVAAAGRSWSPSGTDGSFDIYYSIDKFLPDYFQITPNVINGGTRLYATFYVKWIYGTVSAS